MLCVSKVRTGGHAYYLEVVDTGVEAPGEWLSAGADLLELRGKVAAGDLEAVLAGLDPSSGKRLGRSHDRVKVAGFDLTFCAPKSVSLLYALGAPDVSAEVRSGHNEAVKEALSYVERRALAVRRGSGAHRIPLPVDGVAAGGFVHRTSRALDPHLHTGREGERHSRPGTGIEGDGAAGAATGARSDGRRTEPRASQPGGASGSERAPLWGGLQAKHTHRHYPATTVAPPAARHSS